MQALILRCLPSSTKTLIVWGKEHRVSGLWAPFVERTRRLPRSRKRVSVIVPVLPGYLFIREDSPDISRVLREPHVRHLVGPQGLPASCKLTELVAMQAFLNKTPEVQIELETPDEMPVFPVGAQASVVSGEHFLAGVRGTVLLQQGEEVTLETDSILGRLKISAFLLSPLAL